MACCLLYAIICSMGYGIGVKCKCQDKELMLGVGMGYPSFYRETMEDIRSGKYGAEMRDLVKNGKYIAVDAEKYMYYCDKCGCVEDFTALDLYEPKDIKKIEERVVGRWSAAELAQNKTVKELGELPYFNSDDEDFVLLKEYKHVCPKCGKVMRKIDEEKLKEKTCPKCGEKYQMFSGILWD